MDKRFASLQLAPRAFQFSWPSLWPPSVTMQNRFDGVFFRALDLRCSSFCQSLQGFEVVDAVRHQTLVIDCSNACCQRMKSTSITGSIDWSCYFRGFSRSSCRVRNRFEHVDEYPDDIAEGFFSDKGQQEKGVTKYVISSHERSRDTNLLKKKRNFPVQLRMKELQTHFAENSVAVHPGKLKLVLRRPFSPSTTKDNGAIYFPQLSSLSQTSCMASELDASGEQQSLSASLEALKRIRIVALSDAFFHRMAVQFELKPRSRPLIEYLFALGLEEDGIEKIVIRNKSSMMADVEKVKKRLEFLVSIGVKMKDLSRLIVRHPKILGYSVEKTMKPQIQYFRMLGLPDSKLGRIFTLLPTLLESSPERLLQPRVEYLLEVVGIKNADLSKVLCKSPQILVQNLEVSLEPRIHFFLNELKLSKGAFAKMITKHPQLLHYSVEDNIRPRVKFLRSLGLSDEEIRKVVTRLTQVLSLSIENCLQPKVEYLLKELSCGLNILVSFPAFLSLSLDQRIKPRHRFLIAKKRLPPGPFPMRFLTSTDESFCKREAKSTVEEYNSFRQKLLLTNFAKEFERKHRLQALNPKL
ncbi:hypothetical protein O6H91_19G064700 [Diphasiastrum complanatum]|uniref:Uncharacterized protein n=1 Tax=Diphasiastrum complanatum TaxID=34168 RepID=A0ACC2AWX4_DIPCM|nr:hypothetical protein O6H91_19G064700 [Diphasiastrum complanatum]